MAMQSGCLLSGQISIFRACSQCVREAALHVGMYSTLGCATPQVCTFGTSIQLIAFEALQYVACGQCLHCFQLNLEHR